MLRYFQIVCGVVVVCLSGKSRRFTPIYFTHKQVNRQTTNLSVLQRNCKPVSGNIEHTKGAIHRVLGGSARPARRPNNVRLAQHPLSGNKIAQAEHTRPLPDRKMHQDPL